MLAARDSYAVVDREGRIIAALAGRPRDENWDELMKELTEAIRQAHEKMTFSEKQTTHIRGEFTSVSVGNSFGGGSKVFLQHTLFPWSHFYPASRYHGILRQNQQGRPHEPHCRGGLSTAGWIR